MEKELTLEEVKLPKIKKITDDVFCFEDNQEMVFMPKSKYEENEKKLKALEIIKKYLNVYEVFDGYLLTDGKEGETMILKEEYELLKEVLG